MSTKCIAIIQNKVVADENHTDKTEIIQGAIEMISVIIINHNYAQFVGEAIESVLNQTYQDFELIVIDGDSSDKSRQVITEYAEKHRDKITAVFKPTSGQASAFNLGHKICHGDIITFLDADDYFYETKLEKLAEWHRDYDVIGHGRKFHDDKGVLKEVEATLDDYEDRPMLLHKYGYIYTYNLSTSFISLKKTVADKIFPMPEEDYVTYADVYVKLMAQYYSNIKYMPYPLAYYRIHPAQRSKEFENKARLVEFCTNHYHKSFRDINDELIRRGEPVIPEMDEANRREGLRIANKSRHIKEGCKYVIYGTGVQGEIVLDNLRAMGAEVIFAIESNKNRWGESWNGMPICSLDEAIERRGEYDRIIIGTINFLTEITEILKQRGLKENEDFCSLISMPND